MSEFDATPYGGNMLPTHAMLADRLEKEAKEEFARKMAEVARLRAATSSANLWFNLRKEGKA